MEWEFRSRGLKKDNAEEKGISIRKTCSMGSTQYGDYFEKRGAEIVYF